MKANIYEQITNAIVEQLGKGIVPWQKPWVGGSVSGCVSHTSGKPYSMLNQWLLGCKAGEYLTWKQVVAEGGKVRKGEKAQMVVFWSFVNKTELEAVCDEHGNEIGTRQVVVANYPVLKPYYVFHIDQCDGIKAKYAEREAMYDNTPIERADDIINAYIKQSGLKFNVIDGGYEAYYNSIADKVVVPSLNQYKVTEEYYSTTFHELTHSTGHPKRLNREGIASWNGFGSEQYSKEELVAEIGAAFLCQQAGLDCESAFNNSAAYIQGWLKKLKNDKRMIVAAAAKAEQACKFILTGEK